MCTFLLSWLIINIWFWHSNYLSSNYEFLIPSSKCPLPLRSFGPHRKCLLSSLHSASILSRTMNKCSRLSPSTLECTMVLLQSSVHAALAIPSSVSDSHRLISHSISSGTRNPPLFASASSWKLNTTHTLMHSQVNTKKG